jgi:hypothetical protein
MVLNKEFNLWKKEYMIVIINNGQVFLKDLYFGEICL